MISHKTKLSDTRQTEQFQRDTKINGLLKLILKVLDKPTVVLCCQSRRKSSEKLGFCDVVGCHKNDQHQLSQDYFEVSNLDQNNSSWANQLRLLVPKIKFCISIPVKSGDGKILGSIWVIDQAAGEIEKWKKISLQGIAQEIGAALSRTAPSEFYLIDEQQLIQQPHAGVVSLNMGAVHIPQIQSVIDPFHSPDLTHKATKEVLSTFRGVSSTKAVKKNDSQLKTVLKSLEGHIFLKKSGSNHIKYFSMAS